MDDGQPSIDLEASYADGKPVFSTLGLTPENSYKLSTKDSSLFDDVLYQKLKKYQQALWKEEMEEFKEEVKGYMNEEEEKNQDRI